MADTLINDYELSLKDLTFNSKQIIDVLTTIADENKDQAAGIVQVIINRIYKCLPEQKLYSLYLLDSICKTVGTPYNSLFGSELFKIFSHIYLLVNDQTRARLVKLYDTWMILKLRGSNFPLFPEDQLDKMEKFLRQAMPRSLEPANDQISQQSLIALIDSLLRTLHEAGQSGSDNLASSKVSALQELRQFLLLQSMNQGDLAGIQKKLSEMKSQLEPLQRNNIALSDSPNPSVAQISKTTPQEHKVFTPSAPLNEVTQVKNEPEQPDVVILFQNLVSSGLIKVDQSLKKGSEPEYTLVIPKYKYSPQSLGSTAFQSSILPNSTLNRLSQYEQLKYKELFKIEDKLGSKNPFSSDLQSFITNNKLDASTVQVLYETKPLKCSLCGKRFTDDEKGSNSKRLHLDWHFRINKRQANFKTNVQSRSWYLDTESWIEFQESDLSEFESSLVKKESTPTSKVPQQSYVVIAVDETNMNNICAICREPVKPSINPATEEWVWNDCMLVPGNNNGRKIVHVSCFEEANKKRSAEGDSNSRVKRERLN